METAPAELTDRQLEILERVVQRKAYKVIAAELDISETRVKQHVRAIKDRLEANSMPELVAHYHAVSDGQPFTNREEVLSSPDLSVAEIAASTGRCRKRLGRLLRLSWLAPEIVEAIIEGRQPSILTTKKLIKTGLPMVWSKQKAALGFN